MRLWRDLMTGIHSEASLDPILPRDLPPSILAAADALLRKSRFLAGRLAPQTAARLGRLLRITNAYYSDLIEGQYTEPAALERAQAAPWRERKNLPGCAAHHLAVQALLERRRRMQGPLPWDHLFSPELACGLHRRLFGNAAGAERTLAVGSQVAPGRLRSETGHNVHVGQHAAPDASEVAVMLHHLQLGVGGETDDRQQLLSALAYHHRFAFVHPFSDGNGRVGRLMTHLQLLETGAHPRLWSLPRGLARRRGDYYAALALADGSRPGNLDGPALISQKGYIEFIDFMLDVCHEQVDYMTAALEPAVIRARILRAFNYNERLLLQGVRPGSAAAMIALLSQGRLPRSEIKLFTGLTPRPAIDELTRLVRLDLVESQTPKSRTVTPGLPTWFAEEVFPELHRRFQ